MSGHQLKKPVASSSVALTAVALQDHWLRSINLDTKFGPRKVRLGPAARAKKKTEVKSVIDTGRNRGKSKVAPKEGDKEEKEYVLDKQPPPLTLAQKFGLINAPKPLLTETQWTEVKDKSNKREDSDEPCVICKEDFGLQEQVLLSCTHVFHRACLQAFERFTGRKSCPMCRHGQYQTRVIHEGARLHRHKSATRIQAAWRGYVAHSWYRNLRTTVPPNDPMLRKKFYQEKLSSIVDRMVKSLDINMAAFMREMDDSVKQSRQIFDQWDACHATITAQEWEDIQLKAIERGSEDCPICLTELSLFEGADTVRASEEMGTHPQSQSTSGLAHERPAEKPAKASSSAPKSHGPDRRKAADKKLFEKLYVSAKGKNSVTHPDDASSANPGAPSKDKSSQRLGEPPASARASKSKQGQHKVRSTVLLSCSHVFHSTCLATLEEMAMVDMRNTCPVCRAHYQKKVIVF